MLLVLESFRDELPEFSEPKELKDYIKSIVKKTKLKPKNVFMPLRIALSGRTHGPELPNLIYLWGRQNTLDRLQKTIDKLSRC